jgi:group I intron endonuclease
MIGIYKIQNKINGKIYVGQSTNIENRIKQHFRNAFNENTHTYNYPLSRSIRKYGYENFISEIIEETKIDILTEREQFWINHYNSINNGYNQEDAAESKSGENCNFSKLTNLQYTLIINLLKNTDILMSVIAEEFNVSGSCIEDINNGKRRVQDYLKYPIRKNAKSLSHRGELQNTATLTKNDVITIRNRYVAEDMKVIYDDYKKLISWSGFKKLCFGATWKHIPCYKKQQKIWVYPQ